MDQEYYAHSLPEKPQKDWQRREEHLEGTDKLAVRDCPRIYGLRVAKS
jgi:hypothetical protein